MVRCTVIRGRERDERPEPATGSRSPGANGAEPHRGWRRCRGDGSLPSWPVPFNPGGFPLVRARGQLHPVTAEPRVNSFAKGCVLPYGRNQFEVATRVEVCIFRRFVLSAGPAGGPAWPPRYTPPPHRPHPSHTPHRNACSISGKRFPAGAGPRPPARPNVHRGPEHAHMIETCW